MKSVAKYKPGSLEEAAQQVLLGEAVNLIQASKELETLGKNIEKELKKMESVLKKASKSPLSYMRAFPVRQESAADIADEASIWIKTIRDSLSKSDTTNHTMDTTIKRFVSLQKQEDE